MKHCIRNSDIHHSGSLKNCMEQSAVLFQFYPQILSTTELEYNVSKK